MIPTHCFNRAAATYDNHCALQAKVGEHLIKLAADYYRSSGNILDVGCGTGIVTEKLAQQLNHYECHALDAADSLLQNAKQRLDLNSIQVHLADFNQPIFLNKQFDLLFSNLALHWSNNLLNTLQILYSLQNHQGILAFSIPTTGTFHELSPRFARMDFLSVPSVSHLLKQAGYTLITCYTHSYPLHFPSTLAALQSIKLTGTNYVKNRPQSGLRGKSLIYETPIHTLTYVISYFIAQMGE